MYDFSDLDVYTSKLQNRVINALAIALLLACVFGLVKLALNADEVESRYSVECDGDFCYSYDKRA